MADWTTTTLNLRYHWKAVALWSVALSVLLLADVGRAALLEIPGPNTTLSGVGVISGWKCDAGDLTIRFNNGPLLPLTHGNARQDVLDAGACSHNRVGFVSIMNWGNLGDGQHTAVAYDDGVEFDRATFRVVTPGPSFLRGATGTGTATLSNGQQATLIWSEASQSFVVTEWTSAEEPYPWETEVCEAEGGCPTRYVIEGFDVWISPTVYEAPDYTQAALGRELDILKAQLLWITSHNAVPKTAIQRLIDTGVSIYLDTASDWSAWWPCGDGRPGAGCYSPTWHRIGIAVLGTEWFGRSWLMQDHTRQPMVLHELAHAFHHQVISGGFDNVCITQQYARSKPLYGAVEEREQGSQRAPMHERMPPGSGGIVRHYATTNALEYFAEASEAMFAFNNFYPWSRNDLWDHDPDGYRLVWNAWHDPQGFCPEQNVEETD